MARSDIQRQQERLEQFAEIYCWKKHHRLRGELCDDCRELLDYSSERLARCPHDPKPACKACETHCYTPEYRQRIKDVMKFSGIYFVKRGRLDWLVKYFLAGRRSKQEAAARQQS